MDNLYKTKAQEDFAKKQHELFGEQSDVEASIDFQKGSIELAIVSEDAPNGVKVTLTTTALNAVFKALYGMDTELYDLDTVTSISKVESLIDGKEIELSDNITRAVELTIAKVKLEAMEAGLGNIKQEVRDALQKRIDNNMFQ